MKTFGMVLAMLALLLVAGGLGLWLASPDSDAAGPSDAVIADVASERLTRQGSVVGFDASGESHAWLGVPYAKPPEGELRWQPPQRAEPWADTLDALDYASPCPQLAQPIGGIVDAEPGTASGSEDCLYLNVWAPRFDQDEVPTGDERLPVLFWIHGGSNTTGFAGPFYEGTLLASTHRLVVVTVNYRLGPFGWFLHSSLAGPDSSPESRSGNFGTLDLIAGLEWVRDNIEYFGGDPRNVTIFGESAGGSNVLTLLASRRAGGLFHRAIVQSGSGRTVGRAAASHYVDDVEPGDEYSSAEVTLNLLVADGSASDRASAREFVAGMTAVEVADYLRSRTPDAILAAYKPSPDATRISLPRLIRDGHVLPLEAPVEVFGEVGAYNAVPVILGSNRDESRLFQAFDPGFVYQLLGLPVGIRDRDHYVGTARIGSDGWKLEGVDEPARRLRGSQGPSVYAYRFDWDEEPSVLGLDFATLFGAAHGMEIPFVFGHQRLAGPSLGSLLFDEANAPGRHALSRAMMSYWAEFAYSGAPGRGREGALPEWQPWGGRDAASAAARFLVFDTPTDGGIRMSRDEITRDSFVAMIDDAPHLDQKARCALFHDRFRHWPDYDLALYRGMGRVGCREHPPESILH